MTLFRIRPRRAAVALFASAGILLGLGGAVGAADAHEADGKCVAVSAWIYWSHSHRDYKVGPKQCVKRTEYHDDFYVPAGSDGNETPAGWPGGGGVEVWIPSPL
jgi:hypothetical protein